MLKRVLLAYARWNKNVGYCQGFNILAALILEVVEGNEGDALKVSVRLWRRQLKFFREWNTRTVVSLPWCPTSFQSIYCIFLIIHDFPRLKLTGQTSVAAKFEENDYVFSSLMRNIRTYIWVCVCVSCLDVFDSLQPQRLWPTRPLCPWDSPGKNTGVGCHFRLQDTHIYIYGFLRMRVGEQIFLSLSLSGVQHVGSYFPNQVLNPCSLGWELAVLHWITREIPEASYF